MHYKLDEYLKLPRTQGIVRIFMGDRNYIMGSGVELFSAVRKERKNLLEGTNGNRYLQLDFDTFGEEAFGVEVLETFEGYTTKQMLERKQAHMQNYKNLYNITDGVSRKGVRSPQATREAIRQAAIGRPLAEETKAKIALVKRGEGNPSAKLTEHDIPYIRKMVDKGIERKVIADVYEVNPATIARIAVGKGWSHV